MTGKVLEKVYKQKFSVDQHAINIKTAIENTKKSLFNLVTVVKQAYDDLGDEVFQKELAEKLDMSPSVLCKWKQIGESKICFKNINKLPETFSTLYDISLLEKEYVKKYSEKGIDKLQRLIDKGVINNQTIQSKIQEILREIKDELRDRRVFDIEELKSKTAITISNNKQLNSLLNDRRTFQSFVVKLNKKQLSQWSEGYLEDDIAKDFPVSELRDLSIKQTVQCLIILPAKSINIGLKVLQAFGFTYRDMFIPSLKSEGLSHINNGAIVIRGENGSPRSILGKHIKDSNINNVLDFAESFKSQSHLLVFGNTNRKGWTCLN